MVLQDREHGGAGEAYHQGTVDCLQGAEQLPLRAHDDVAIAQSGEVDPGVIDGLLQGIELPEPQEEPAPDADLGQVAQHHQSDDAKQSQHAGQGPLASIESLDVEADAPDGYQGLQQHVDQDHRDADQKNR